MKKVFFIPLLILLFTSNLSSQITKIESEKPIKETKVAPMGTFWASMEFYKDYSIIRFQDANFQQISNIKSFRLSNEDIDKLYNLLVKTDAKLDDEYHIETLNNKTTLYLRYIKYGKKAYPNLYLYEGKYDSTASRFPPMTMKQFAKLFGK